MKIVRFWQGEEARVGVVIGDGVADVTGRFSSIRQLIIAGIPADLAQAKPTLKLSEIKFAVPVANVTKILCAGRNYRAYHELKEEGKDPGFPSIFGRFQSSFAAHNQPLERPKVSEQLDYEGELVVAIGKGGRHIAREDAMKHVAAYTVANEGTIRDWAKAGTQNLPSKNFNRCGAMGPWLVTADEIADPMKLRVVTRRNGQVVQDGNTDQMIFDIAFLISHISKFMDLGPGDMICTGSPGGSAIESKPPDWLKPGDVMEMEVAGVGVLRNTVVDEA